MASVSIIALKDIADDIRQQDIKKVEYYYDFGKICADVWVFSPSKMAISKEIRRLNAELGLKSINNFQKRK